MGKIASKFMKKKSTGEILAALDNKIKSIERYGWSMEERRRKVVGNLVIISVGLYIIAILIFYFYFQPISWKDGIIYCIPLLVSPMLIVLLRNLIARYYDWRLRRNKLKLNNIRGEKKRILEEVMDKETYNVAKDLLQKYGNSDIPEVEKPLTQIVKAPTFSTPIKSGALTPMLPGNQLRHRLSSGPLQPIGFRTPQSAQPLGARTPNAQALQPVATPNQTMPLMEDRLPRPVMSNSGGGAFDRLVDYLIGDGPGHRFALICASCKSHNGMALPEEFEYLSFRCAYCRHLNPSRKTRPKPPALLSTPLHTDTSDHKSSTDNSDIEDTPPRPPPIGFNTSVLSQGSSTTPPPSERDETNDSHHMSVDEVLNEAETVDENKTEGHLEDGEEELEKNEVEKKED